MRLHDLDALHGDFMQALTIHLHEGRVHVNKRRSSSPRQPLNRIDMLGFASPTPLSVRLRQPTPARCATRLTPCAVLENPAPKALDEVVRGWFSRGETRKSGKSSGKAGASAGEELLSSEISGPQAASETEAHYLLSTTVVARAECAADMASLLKEFSTAASACIPDEGLLACAVNQSPDDPGCFLLFERFRGPAAMTKYQKGAVYQNFIRSAQPLLEKPFGMHICKEIGGKISLSYHPFGPAGTCICFFRVCLERCLFCVVHS